MPDAIAQHERDFELEDDIRTVKDFARSKREFDKLKANTKRFAKTKKAVEEERDFLTTEMGKSSKPSK